jgi:hypothetical protein
MAYDNLGTFDMAENIQAGDRIVWMNAGAYHVSWETTFSQPRARILWHDGNGIREIRQRQSFSSWWKEHGSP